MNIVPKVMEKSWKFVGKNVYEPCIIIYIININIYIFCLSHHNGLQINIAKYIIMHIVIANILQTIMS